MERDLNHIKKHSTQQVNMKEILKKIGYPLMILLIAASCSSPRYASAQNDGYYDDNGYSNNDNYNNNQDYNNQDQKIY